MTGKTSIGAWVADIEDATLTNTNFRTVLFTGMHTQLTVMRLKQGEEIGRGTARRPTRTPTSTSTSTELRDLEDLRETRHQPPLVVGH
jgi:hypothetical protein